jgi:hypothetical protein
VILLKAINFFVIALVKYQIETLNKSHYENAGNSKIYCNQCCLISNTHVSAGEKADARFCGNRIGSIRAEIAPDRLDAHNPNSSDQRLVLMPMLV